MQKTYTVTAWNPWLHGKPVYYHKRVGLWKSNNIILNGCQILIYNLSITQYYNTTTTNNSINIINRINDRKHVNWISEITTGNYNVRNMSTYYLMIQIIIFKLQIIIFNITCKGSHVSNTSVKIQQLKVIIWCRFMSVFIKTYNIIHKPFISSKWWNSWLARFKSRINNHSENKSNTFLSKDTKCICMGR